MKGGKGEDVGIEIYFSAGLNICHIAKLSPSLSLNPSFKVKEAIICCCLVSNHLPT